MTDLRGLAAAWDSTPSLRASLRANQPLIQEVSEKLVDIRMASKHAYLLIPVLERMVKGPKKKVPNIEQLRVEVREVLVMNKQEPDTTTVEKCAWHIRKNLGFVKLKTRRREVSTESQPHIYVHSFDLQISLRILSIPHTVVYRRGLISDLRILPSRSSASS